MRAIASALMCAAAAATLPIQTGAVAAQDACERLATLSMPHREILSTQAIPAGQFLAPDGTSYQVPSFCRIRGSRPVERVGGVKYTLRDGMIWDAKALLADVRKMVADEKAKK